MRNKTTQRIVAAVITAATLTFSTVAISSPAEAAKIQKMDTGWGYK